MFPLICTDGPSNIFDRIVWNDGSPIITQRVEVASGAVTYVAAVNHFEVHDRWDEMAQLAYANYRATMPQTMRAIRAQNLGFAPNPWQFFIPLSCADGVFSQEWQNRIGGSIRYKVNEIMCSFAGQGVHGKRGAGTLGYWFIPAGIKKQIPVLTNGYATNMMYYEGVVSAAAGRAI